MTERSIIFFDIDGTLYDTEKKVPQSTKDAISTLKEKGHEVAIATGRAPFMYEDLREELDIQTYVSFNGQFVVLNGEVIEKNPLNLDALHRLTEHSTRNEHPLVYLTEKEMKSNIEFHDRVKESLATLQFPHPESDPDFFKDKDIFQALLFCTAEEEKQYELGFEDFHYIRWHRVSTDVLPKGGSKAEGIEAIVKRLGYSNDRVYAFGDGPNDIEMLESVENSVAMGNASRAVKEAAKYITQSVDEDGIMHGLRLVGLI